MHRLSSVSCLLAAFASPASACSLITSNKEVEPAVPETFNWNNAKAQLRLNVQHRRTGRALLWRFDLNS